MYWLITLPEKLLLPFSRWLNRQVFYYENLTAESIDLLTDEQVQDIDQFILRYTKLQDTMGTRLFSSILKSIRTWFRNAYPILELGKELPDMPGNWSGYGS
jgi:hypothetical protein